VDELAGLDEEADLPLEELLARYGNYHLAAEAVKAEESAGERWRWSRAGAGFGGAVGRWAMSNAQSSAALHTAAARQPIWRLVRCTAGTQLQLTTCRPYSPACSHCAGSGDEGAAGAGSDAESEEGTAALLEEDGAAAEQAQPPALDGQGTALLVKAEPQEAAAGPSGAAAAAAAGDRKSTRLNSSHITISYAVFCLKKKTTKL